MKEIEAKIKLNNLSIIESGNLILTKQVHVLDIYFDNKTLNFKGQDKVLRLRLENEQCLITFKGAREQHEKLLVRDEFETEIASLDIALKIIKGLDFYEVAKVEKNRKYFSIAKYPSLSITLDQYPFIGDYLEVEGEESEVISFLDNCGGDLNQPTQKNCTELFLDHCVANNLPFKNPQAHFTFEDEKNIVLE